MEGRFCERCGKELSPGGLAYVVHIKVYADFDGVLPESGEGVEQQLRKILEQIQESDPDELEKEVFEELTLILCKSCRDRFMEETKHPWEGPFQPRKDPDQFIH